MTRPLDGVRVLELAGIGPAPYGVQLLADFGAEVTRIDRVSAARNEPGREARYGALSRGRRSVALDLKQPAGVDLLLRLVDQSDVLVDPYRPGATDRLGIGPEVCRDRNDRLIYARLSGWGVDGPLAARAGHDLNFLALAGALRAIGEPSSPPPPPLNYLADFAGGGLFLVIGVLLALAERASSGQGQIIDVAMIDGAASLSTYYHGLLDLGLWSEQRGANELDGGAPYYACYETLDGEYVAVGAIEPKFYGELLERLGLDVAEWPQHDPTRWPQQKKELATIFGLRTRDEWTRLFEGSDACVTPVLSFREAPTHPHNRARGSFLAHDGELPAPAPRLSRTPARPSEPAPGYGEHSEPILTELGLTSEDVQALRARGIVA